MACEHGVIGYCPVCAGVCGCHRCLAERKAGRQVGKMFIRESAMRMVVCDCCGNKRCPHATDHRHGCTGSNKPGQAGSIYSDEPTPEWWGESRFGPCGNSV